MMNFTDETKRELGKYFTEGVHEVVIESVIAGTTQEGKEFFEFELLGENDETGTARIYWTDKAAPYSFNTVRDIFVHNTIEKNKPTIRETIESTKNTEELLKLCSINLKGKKCWYKVEKTGTTYRNTNGEEKNSYNKNIYGYEPKMKPTQEDMLASLREEGGIPIDNNEVPFN